MKRYVDKYNIEAIPNTYSIAGESPVWDSGKKILYWIDFIEGKINCLDIAKDELKTLYANNKVGTVVLREIGGLLTATGTGFNFVNVDFNTFEIISHPEPGRTNNRFNDGKCDCRGRLWISTVSQDFEKGCATMYPLGSLYCLATNLEVKTVIKRVVQLNGIAWSPDNSKMYIVDTCSFKILQFDFDEANGSISNEKTAVQIPEDFSYPDGMCRDVEGTLWVAHWGGYQVSRWDPESGKLIEKIPLPAPNVTCCSFGGHDLDWLFITTASFGMTEEQLKKYPDAGKIFKLMPGIKGPEPFRFKG
ncbi:MAG: SMP-30/gluconolactonase/LRE family protein [Actinobacteria bacterium]|nr:SMP-30/gluconolactonase/LRE family protein [Actinomycetota bacterium]